MLVVSVNPPRYVSSSGATKWIGLGCGGPGHSSIGRELLGDFGLMNFLEPKQVGMITYGSVALSS